GMGRACHNRQVADGVRRICRHSAEPPELPVQEVHVTAATVAADDDVGNSVAVDVTRGRLAGEWNSTSLWPDLDCNGVIQIRGAVLVAVPAQDRFAPLIGFPGAGDDQVWTPVRVPVVKTRGAQSGNTAFEFLASRFEDNRLAELRSLRGTLIQDQPDVVARMAKDVVRSNDQVGGSVTVPIGSVGTQLQSLVVMAQGGKLDGCTVKRPRGRFVAPEQHHRAAGVAGNIPEQIQVAVSVKIREARGIVLMIAARF